MFVCDFDKNQIQLRICSNDEILGKHRVVLSSIAAVAAAAAVAVFYLHAKLNQVIGSNAICF